MIHALNNRPTINLIRGFKIQPTYILYLVRKVQRNMQKLSNLDIVFRFNNYKMFRERLSPEYAGMWACVPKNISILTGTFG